MAAYPQKKITISVVVPFLVFIIFFSIMIWQKYQVSLEVPASPPSVEQEGSKSITLFFGDNDTCLAREAREIDACKDANACLKSVLDELLNGPVGDFDETIPDGTTVDAVNIDGDLATIDLNQTFVESMLSGSLAEMLAVYSIVNTVAANFPQIQKVKLNVQGKSEVTLNHLDLSEPLVADYSLEKVSPPVSGKASTGATNIRQGDIK